MALRVYLDTSVFSAYYDEKATDRRMQIEEANIAWGQPSIDIVAPPEI